MRVIAGRWGGLRLASPRGRAVRPTTDRVKEAMFAALHFRLPGSIVLDMFGGSGALGVEAASRGAARVVIVEESLSAQRTIEENLRRVGNPDAIELLALPWHRVAEKLEGHVRFDIVLMDPPYASGIYTSSVISLQQHTLIHPGSIAVLESDVELDLDVAGFAITKRKRYGSVHLLFGEFDDSSEVQ